MVGGGAEKGARGHPPPPPPPRSPIIFFFFLHLFIYFVFYFFLHFFFFFFFFCVSVNLNPFPASCLYESRGQQARPRLALVLFVDFGTTRKPELDERKDLTGVYFNIN